MPFDDDGILPQQFQPQPSITQIALLGTSDDASPGLLEEAEPPPFVTLGFPKDWEPFQQSFMFLREEVTPPLNIEETPPFAALGFPKLWSDVQRIAMLGTSDIGVPALTIEAEPPSFAAIGFPKDWEPVTQSFVMLPEPYTPFPPPGDAYMSVLSIEDVWTWDPAHLQIHPPFVYEEVLRNPSGSRRQSMATPLTQLAIRQQILEPWLAEINSDFYTQDVIDKAINGEYKLFCAETLAGPVATFTTTGDGVTRYFALPPEIVDIWRVDYDTGSGQIEVPFMAFQNFSPHFGTQWAGVTAPGMPLAYCVMGDYSIGFHPIPDVKTFSVTGPVVPDDLTYELDILMVSSADAYTIAKRAYLWLVERTLMRGGTAPPNYQRTVEEVKEETKKAQERIRRLYGGLRVAGRVGTATGPGSSQGFGGPKFQWP